MRCILWSLCIGLTFSSQAEGLLDCLGIESDDARLRCYDEVAARQDTPAPATEPPAVTMPAPAASQDQTFGRSAEDMSAIIAKVAGVDEVDEISATVIRVTRDPHGRFAVLLDSQQRWRQIGAERFKIKAGDEIVIRRAALSSYSLQRRSGGRKTKVRRLD